MLGAVDEENKTSNVRQEAPEVNGSVGLWKWVGSFLFSWLFDNGEKPGCLGLSSGSLSSGTELGTVFRKADAFPPSE